MKTILPIVFILISAGAYCQRNEALNVDVIPNRSRPYYFSTNRTDSLAFVYEKYLDDIYNRRLSLNRRGRDSSSYIFNSKMLNVFFANEITSYASSAKNISLEKYIVSLGSDNKTLTIGRNFDGTFFNKLFTNHQQSEDYYKLKKLTHVFTINVAAGISDGFSQIYSENTKTKEYEVANDIMLTARYTHFNNGTINFGSHENHIKELRVNAIREFAQTVEATALAEYNSEIEILKIKNNLRQDESGYNANEMIIADTLKKRLIKEKYHSIYKKIADKEVEMIKKDSVFSHLRTSWWGFELNAPVRRKVINLMGDADPKFSSWKALVSYNFFQSFSAGWSYNLSCQGAVFNNNNFYANKTKTLLLETYSTLPGNQQLILTSENVYNEDFDEFITTSLRFEASSLFIDNSLGLSAAVEKNIGVYNPTDWKIGIPVSLKDKDNKPVLNFEAQWREVNGVHVIGISTGFVFGKFIK